MSTSNPKLSRFWWIASVFAAAMALVAFTANANGPSTDGVQADSASTVMAADVDAPPTDAEPKSAPRDTANSAAAQEINLADANTYIVVLNDTPLASYRGGVAGYAPTNPQTVGIPRLDVNSDASQAYLGYLAERRTNAIKTSEDVLGRNLEVAYEYGATLVGFAAKLTAAEADRLQELDAVRFVQEETISYPQTDAGPEWSGADQVWGGDWEAMEYMATLEGAQEVPPVTTDVSGMGYVTYNYYSNELTYHVVISNPSGVELTAAHIHEGAAGENGGVIAAIFSTPSTAVSQEYTGTVSLADVEEALLPNAELYFNVHSTDNAGGEVRGQIELNGTLGEGVVVGILDTGIDPWNPSFAAVGDDGYQHTNPLGDGNYLGVCDPNNTTPPDGVVGYDDTFPCNDKLIGVWGYTASDASPRDTDGHGSHTAGTVAGNFIEDSVITVTTVFMADISGVAPHANIIAYDVCADGGGCSGAALSAARDQALLDGVDVINYSIGSSAPTGDFWEDAESLQWLALRDAGVFVATSNGNAGPGDATTGSPADLPWITSVGANTHDRKFTQSLIMTDGSTTVTVTGEAMTAGYGPAEVVFAEDYAGGGDDARLCAPDTFPAGTFSGEIVICERGEYGRVAKGQAVLDGGAGGYVLAQPEEFGGGPGALASDPHVLPGIHIDYYNYQDLLQLVITDSVGTVNGTLTGAVLDQDPSNGDIMASFSSRGPNRTDADLIVPKVTAPGRAIWAPYAQGPDGDGDYTWFVIQGTSMSSPHTAGAGALLKATRPAWTPAQMESALMLTARNTVLNDDGVNIATPFAQGAGHIAVGEAMWSPLAMDVTTAEYEGADPALDNDFDVRDLNIASLGEDACIGDCTWVRTVTNVSDETLTWDVSGMMDMTATVSADPVSFTLAAGESQAVEVTVDVSALDTESDWYFGTLMLDETSDMYPDAHMPIAVYPASGNLPETLEIETQTETGTATLDEIISVGITNLNLDVTGLVVADQSTDRLVQHPGPLDVFPDIFFVSPTATLNLSREVGADAFSVIAEVAATESPDLDMILFWDADGDDVPELSDIGDLESNPYACQSASGGSFEFCEIENPVPGTYFIAVVNWAASGEGANDSLTVAHAIVPMMDDLGNMAVSGPMSNPAGQPYSLTVDFDLTQGPAVQANDKLYGAFYVGADDTMTGSVGTTKVYLDYLGMPEMSVAPNAVSTELLTGLTAQEMFTITNSGDGDLEWSTARPAQGLEIIQDGSFEEGSPNPHWDSFSGLVSFLPICSPETCVGVDQARTGNWYTWFGGSSGSAFTSVATQTVTIPDTGDAFLSFWMNSQAAPSADADFYVKVDGNIVATYDETSAPDFSEYTQVIIPLDDYADGGTYNLVFEYVKTVAAPDTNLNFFVDDVSVQALPAGAGCSTITEIPFLSASPESGMLAGMSDQAVDLTFDAAGYTNGTYTDTLCVTSTNDPVNSLLAVDVAMTVSGEPAGMMLDTTSMSAMHTGSAVSTQTVTITNTGDAPLEWAVATDIIPMRDPGDVFMEEGFEGTGFPPADWTLVDGANDGETWRVWSELISGFTPHTGDGAAGVFYAGDTREMNEILVSPYITEEVAALNFWSAGSLTWCRDDFDNCDLDVWLIYGDTIGDSDDMVIIDNVEDGYAASSEWTEFTYNLTPHLTGEPFRIAFHYTGADGDLISIDDVMVYGPAACELPTSLSWLNADPSSGTVAGNSSATMNMLFDSTDLEPGTYTGTACMTSNDAGMPLMTIPVTLTVEAPTAEVQVMHLAPFSDSDTAVDVYVDGSAVLTDVVFNQSSGYLTVPAGMHELAVNLAGTMTTAVTATVDLVSGTQYSVLATGGANGYDLSLMPLVDNNAMLGSGEGGVRVGHLAPFTDTLAATSVDIVMDMGNTPVVTDVMYGDVSGYLALPAGDYDLRIVAHGTDTVIADLMPITVMEGMYVSAFAIGDTMNQPLDVVAVPGSGFAGTPIPSIVDPGTANVQVMHLAPFSDSDTAVDVYVDGSVVLTNVVFNTSSGYMSVPAGEHLLEVNLAGTMTTAISATVDLMADMDYSVLATGGVNGYDLSLMPLVDNNAPLSDGQGGVRVGHLAPFNETLADTSVDIVMDMGNTPVVTDVVYGAVSPYLALPAGEYDLRIVAHGTDTVIADLMPVTVMEGMYVSAFAIGDTVNQPLDVVAVPGSGFAGTPIPSIVQTGYTTYLPIISR